MCAIRNALITGLLFLACIIGLQVSFLLLEATRALAEMQTSVSSVLSSANDLSRRASETLELAQSTLSSQQGYYRDSASHIKALTKAAAIDAIRLGRLIEKVNDRVDGIADNTNVAITEIGSAAKGVGQDSKRLTDETVPLLRASTEAVTDASKIAGDENIQKSVAALEQSSENVQKTTAEAAEAMGYIRDMLSPAKKSFWKRLLYLLVPRPTVGVP